MNQLDIYQGMVLISAKRADTKKELVKYKIADQ